jgi:hypothetical protein
MMVGDGGGSLTTTGAVSVVVRAVLWVPQNGIGDEDALERLVVGGVVRSIAANVRVMPAEERPVGAGDLRSCVCGRHAQDGVQIARCVRGCAVHLHASRVVLQRFGGRLTPSRPVRRVSGRDEVTGGCNPARPADGAVLWRWQVLAAGPRSDGHPAIGSPPCWLRGSS